MTCQAQKITFELKPLLTIGFTFWAKISFLNRSCNCIWYSHCCKMIKPTANIKKLEILMVIPPFSSFAGGSALQLSVVQVQANIFPTSGISWKENDEKFWVTLIWSFLLVFTRFYSFSLVQWIFTRFYSFFTRFHFFQWISIDFFK